MRFDPTTITSPPTSDELERLQELVGTALPPDYRQYLQHFHGGLPTEKDYWLPHLDRPWIEDIDQMFTVHYLCKRLHEERLNNERGIADYPTGMFPIAHNGCGDEVLLSVWADDYGSIYHRFHEESSDDPDDMRGMYRIADSSLGWLADPLHQSEVTTRLVGPARLSVAIDQNLGRLLCKVLHGW